MYGRIEGVQHFNPTSAPIPDSHEIASARLAGLLEVKCVPWLPEEPVAAVDLDLLPVSTVMHSPVTTLQVGHKIESLN